MLDIHYSSYFILNELCTVCMSVYMHPMIDKAKSLSDQPLMEDFYMFHVMVRNEGERLLTYVHEADRINV